MTPGILRWGSRAQEVWDKFNQVLLRVVQIADELVNMIVAQRDYQANAQVISTANQITQTLLNIR